MKKKTVVAVLGITATLLTGCTTEEFNPAAEYELDMYGPAPIIQEQEDNSLEIEQEQDIVDDFNPAIEYEAEEYGPIPMN